MPGLEVVQNVTQATRVAATGRFQCLECQQTFGRVEHLTRHSRSHIKESFLRCSQCRKGFYRIDALKRHEQVHNEPRRSTLGKGARACLSCAAARRRCSGGIPCSGCNRRSIDCKYPESGGLRSINSGFQSNHAANAVSTPGGNSAQSGDEQNPGTPQGSLMSWSIASESPASYPRQARNPLTPQTGGCQIIDQTQRPEVFSSAGGLMGFPEARNRSETSASPGLTESALCDSQMPQSVTAFERPQAPSDTYRKALNDATLETSSHFESSTANITRESEQVPNPETLSDTWLHHNFSSINWLPDNWTPDVQGAGGDALDPFDQGQPLIFGQTNQTNPARYSRNSDQTSSSSLQYHRHGESIPLLQQIVGGQGVSSPGSQSAHSPGHYYVDGDGARLPRVRKPPYRYSDSHTHLSRNEGRGEYSQLKFPVLDEGQNQLPSTSSIDANQIPQGTYYEIVRMFNLTCITSTHYSNFHSRSFPSLQLFSQFVRLYTENFQSILPFIHPPTFDISATHWLLILALAAVGSHYMDVQDAEILIVAMHELLHRAIETVIEAEGESIPNSVSLVQAKILNCVGMMYCGDERLMKMTKTYHSDLVSFCEEEWGTTSAESSNLEAVAEHGEEIGRSWNGWCEAETSRRTGYCIWLLDCMWAFHFQKRPLLSLEDACLPVPCQEVLWEAQSALDWQQLHACATPSPSLHSAIQLAYIEKRLQSSMGEFSRILCIHALFRRTWEVETYFSQPLTLWTPTASKQDIRNLSTSTLIWLPGIQTYAKWRNSACDCLDILHWHANSVIGAASGMEHPTVLHLHLARVILLTPFREILKLVHLMTESKQSGIIETRKYVQCWALEDQYKARLAMIHAGVLFWHVRRFSTDAFYEPSSVFLATLALWAYGTFTPHTSGAHREGGSPPGEEDDDDARTFFPTSMQLDRPADDELVQLFVKRGASMKANITGVGNLCSVKGPVRVLIEGRNVLAGLKTWGVSRRAVRTLSKLIEICGQDIPV